MGKEMKFCPNCGSTDVEPDNSNYIGMIVGGNSDNWNCNQCEFTGMMPEEYTDYEKIKTKKLELGKKQKYSKNILGYGNRYLKYVLNITFVLIIVFLTVRFL